LSHILPIATFFVAVAFLWVGKIVAMKFGFADKPGGRKKHDTPVPPIGGLVILPVFMIFSQIAGLDFIVPWPLIAGLCTLLIMGAIDDAITLKPWIKFFVMLWTCCFVVVFGQAEITSVGDLFGFGEVQLGFMADAFTVMAIVLLMNAINMIDGVDGLAGGFCALVVFWMMATCYATGQMGSFNALSILLAALLAFLCFNLRHPLRKNATIFLGDSGALCLGLLLGWFCVKLTQQENPPLEPATVIWIIALPVMDAFGLFVARSVRGLHPFYPDRRHLHHRFIDAGIMPAHTTFIMLGLYSIFAFIGFFAQAKHVPPVYLFWGWMAVFILHTALIIYPRGYDLWARYWRKRLHFRRG